MRNMLGVEGLTQSAGMAVPLRVLIVEDSQDDTELFLRELRRSGYSPDWLRVEDEARFLQALDPSPDIILLDYRLPEFNALRGLELLRDRGLKIPCIVVSGILNDEMAVECIRQGADDYLLKDRLARLGTAVDRAIREKESDEEQTRTQHALHESEAQFLRFAENARDLIFRYQLGGKPKFLYVSPSVREITGYTAEEMYADSQLWAERIVSDGSDGALPPSGPEATGTCLTQLGPKLRFRTKSGKIAWLEQRVVTVRSQDGKLEGVEGIIRDITESEIRERELQSIVTLAGAMRAAPNRTEIYTVILQQLTEMLKADGVALAIRQPVSEEMVVELANGLWSGQVGRHFLQSPPRPEAPNRPDKETGEIFSGARDVVTIPMISQGQTIGSIWVGRDTEIAGEEIRLLSAAADIAGNALRRASLHEQTQRRLQHITALRAIDMAITSSLDLRVTLNFFLDQVTIRLGVHAASVLLLDPQTQILQYMAGRGFHTQSLQNTKLHLGEGTAGRAALERQMIAIPDLTKRGDNFRRSPLLAEEGFISYFAAPLVAKGQVKGVLEIFHRALLEPDSEWLEFLDTLAVQAAIAIDNAALFEDLQRSNLDLAIAYDATIEGWSRALDMRDQETEGHTQRVTDMTVRMAREMGIGDDELVHVRRGALLHDIGKMGIPDNILLKPGPLTEEEWSVMHRHPDTARDLLTLVNYLRPAITIPYCHHEKWDGTGYPRGLREEAIPLSARIFAAVDVWDALRSDRPYRPAWPEEKVTEYLLQNSGKHFDPHVVNVFMKVLEQETGRKKTPSPLAN